MGKTYNIFIWKKAPFLRLLLPVIAGIITGYYLKLEIDIVVLVSAILLSVFIIFNMLPLAYRFKLRAANGIIITAFFINIGVFLTWNKDVRNHTDWYGKKYDTSSYIIATINEPPVEKSKSYKVLATVNAIINKDSVYQLTGKLLLYFSKDSLSDKLMYGNQIIIKKQLQEIKSAGNPAAFNYARYCAFQQIFHQCYLKNNDWVLLKSHNVSVYKKIIFKTQEYIIHALNKYIAGSDEAAIGKALVIGYKADLDKDLVQAYSNAGVIHLIVIAGLHLGLIYILLVWITAKIPLIKNSKVACFIVIFTCLWFFAFLTGASPPVMRAVVMFSFIALGKLFNKRSSVYNSLAISAFVNLCFNPYSLWDAGFQLSYFAVLGIVLSQKLIYNWLYLKNKILKEAWKIASVSLAAQVFILPACLYYFHQMPLLFMFTNIAAIPLAICIFYTSIVLILISAVPFLALYIGKAVTLLIWLLNHLVLFINALPFSLWDGISITAAQTVMLYFVFIFFLYWFIKKNMTAFKLGIYGALVFTIIITLNKWNYSKQRKIIVYDIPAHKAIDFISGNSYQFVGDNDLAANDLLQNFHLKPARISLMLNKKKNDTNVLYHNNNFYQFYNKKIAIIDSSIIYKPSAKKINVDYIIISKNPKLYISTLAAVFNCSVYIFDASCPMWKIDKWKKDCEDLHLPFHSVPEQGAFIIDL